MSKRISNSQLLLCAVILTALWLPISAQTEEERAAIRATGQALALFKAEQYVEAIPHFEIAIKALPDIPMLRFAYGFCLVAKSKQTSNTEEAKQLSAKALEQFLEAKKLGLTDPANDALISLLSGKPAPSDPKRPNYSNNAEAEKAMIEGESFFAQSKYDEAVKLYEKALSLDPTIYHAANAAGNAFVAKGEWESAEKWYQRGIKIDPNRETAYRWSATPFMKQKKYDQARERYIEAFIVEPYSRMAPQGMNQWAEVTGSSLGHPQIDVPEFAFDAKGKAVPKSPISADDANVAPWISYIATRERWKNETFAQKPYRHSLSEEAESLRAAVKSASDRKSPNKQFDVLAALDKEGLLESYILLALPDDGIAEDHPEYLKTNRDKLRQYVVKYVIQK